MFRFITPVFGLALLGTMLACSGTDNAEARTAVLGWGNLSPKKKTAPQVAGRRTRQPIRVRHGRGKQKQGQAEDQKKDREPAQKPHREVDATEAKHMVLRATGFNGRPEDVAVATSDIVYHRYVKALSEEPVDLKEVLKLLDDGLIYHVESGTSVTVISHYDSKISKVQITEGPHSGQVACVERKSLVEETDGKHRGTKQAEKTADVPGRRAPEKTLEKTATAGTPENPSRKILGTKGENVPVATSEAGLDRAEFHDAGDETGLRQLNDAGLFRTEEGGIEVLVIDLGWWGNSEVRMLDGPSKGRLLWVRTKYLKPIPKK